MYLKKNFFSLNNKLLLSILPIIFVSCFNNTKKGSASVSEDSPIILEEIGEYCNSDTSFFISECKNMLLKYTEEREKKFLLQLTETFEKFSNKVLDTVLYTTCFIETNEKLDTIKTRIFEDRDSIIVHSSWVKNNKLLWEKKITNPYIWVDDDPFFENNKWITFTTGIYYAPPNIYKIEDFIRLKEWAVGLGLNELQELDSSIDRESYEQYFENFNGNLIEWGDPESREGLFIWYKPLQRFVVFYRP